MQHPCYPLYDSIWKRLDLFSKVRISHIHREANQVVDGFTEFGLSIQAFSRVFYNVPNFVATTVRAECLGIVFPCGF